MCYHVQGQEWNYYTNITLGILNAEKNVQSGSDSKTWSTYRMHSKVHNKSGTHFIRNNSCEIKQVLCP